MTQPRTIPSFANEDEEREFWETHDATDYFDFGKTDQTWPMCVIHGRVFPPGDHCPVCTTERHAHDGSHESC